MSGRTAAIFDKNSAMKRPKVIMIQPRDFLKTNTFDGLQGVCKFIGAEA